MLGQLISLISPSAFQVAFKALQIDPLAASLTSYMTTLLPACNASITPAFFAILQIRFFHV